MGGALVMHDEATFFTNEAIGFFWGERMDAAMRQKSTGSGRMKAGLQSDEFESGIIRVPDEKKARFREYLVLRGKIPGSRYQVSHGRDCHFLAGRSISFRHYPYRIHITQSGVRENDTSALGNTRCPARTPRGSRRSRTSTGTTTRTAR
jgi:hypothetical protein